MNEEKIKEYIDNEVENEYLDFKIKPYNWKKDDDKCAFLTDVLSFANSNTEKDKYIILGVKVQKDGTRNYRGILKSEMEDSAEYQQLVSENIEPSTISIEVKTISHNGKEYGIIRIFNCNNRPYLMKKKYCSLEAGFTKIRRGSRNNNLTRYLLDEIYENKNPKLNSEFKIYGLDNGKIVLNATLKNFDFPDMTGEKEEIIKIIKGINDFEIDDYVKENNEIDKSKINTSGLINIKKAFPSTMIEFDEKDINIIQEFSKAFGIELSDNFFEVGNAVKVFNGIGGNGISIFTKYKTEGSKKSIKKLEMINELIERLKRALAWLKYINATKKIKYIELVIEEIGNIDDEDIEVNIELPKGIYIDSEKFPRPDDIIIDEINKHYSEKMFKPYYTEKDISEFRAKPAPRTKPFSNSYLPIYSGDVKILDGIYDYIDYEIDELREKTILRFTIKNIKEKEKIVFPGNILVKGDIKEMNYYIISNNSKKKIEGTIKVK